MKISEKGLKLVRAFEGCLKPVPGLSGHFRAYRCPADKLTIGWGHTNDHGRQFNEGSVWTQAECDAELASDMARFEAVVERLVKVELKQHQFDALVSFAYNCGAGALEKSTLLRKINNRDFAGAASEFNRWTHGGGRVLPGLVRRRASESLLFQGVADDNFDGKPDELIHIEESEPVPQQVDAPQETSISESTIVKGGAVIVAGSGAGMGSSIWNHLTDVPMSVLDTVTKLVVDKPESVLFAVCGSAGVYVIYRRWFMKREQGV